MFKKLSKWFTKKEPLRKVRLLEFENFLSVYHAYMAPIQTLSLRSTVLVEGLIFYVEGYLNDPMRLDMVGYLSGVEFLRVNSHKSTLQALDSQAHDALIELREHHRLRRLDSYLKSTFIEGSDCYTFEDLRANVRSADTIELEGRIFKTLGLPVGLELDDNVLMLELSIYYPKPITVRADRPLKIDSKLYDLCSLFLKDLEGNCIRTEAHQADYNELLTTLKGKRRDR